MEIKEYISDNTKYITNQENKSAFLSKINTFVDCAKYVNPEDINKYVVSLVNITNSLYPHINTLHYWMFFLSKKHPQHIVNFLRVMNTACDKKCDGDLIERLGNDILICLRRFPNLVSDAFYNNFTDIILPEACAGKSIFAFRGTRWFDDHNQKGGTGPADFAYKCYAMPFSSSGLHELIHMYKELPSGNFQLFEQIRKDGIFIGHHGVFGAALGDIIHNSAPFVKELISAMVNYYKTSNKALLQQLQDKYNFIIPNLYDLEKYDTLCESQETTISILRRLNYNFNQAKLYCPQLPNVSLQNQIKSLEKNMSASSIENVLHSVNNYIISNIKDNKTGVAPDFVQCCVWLDNKVFEFLNGLDFEGQFRINTGNTFKEILIFNELLNNPDFYNNQSEFETFYNNDVLHAPTELAFRAVATRQNEHMCKLNVLHDKLKVLYNIDEDIVFNRKQRTWSGNMFGSLQRLLPYKEASTVLGQRYKKEREELDLHLYSIIQYWNGLFRNK